MSVLCPYCDKPAELTDSAEIYGKSYGNVWLCQPCDARVGTHPDGRPVGTLAKPELRELRKRFHAAFDPLWKEQEVPSTLTGRKRKRFVYKLRERCYKELAKRLKMTVADVHGGHLTESTAPRALAAVEEMACG